VRKQDDSKIVFAGLQIHGGQVLYAGFRHDSFEFGEGALASNWQGLADIGEGMNRKDSAIPVNEFADVIARPRSFERLEKAVGKILLNRGQQPAPALVNDDGGTVDGQRGTQPLERSLHARDQIFGKKQAPRVYP